MMSNTGRFFVSPGWRVFLHDVGLDVGQILRRAEMPEDLFARGRAQLTTSEYFRLWTSIEEEAGDFPVPLRLSNGIAIEAFDAPIFAAICSPNLNTALTRLAHYKKLIASTKLEISISPTETSVEVHWPDKSARPPQTLEHCEMVFFTQLARIGTRARICPIRVELPVVPQRHQQEYFQFLGAPIHLGERVKLSFSAADAERPFLTANESMWQYFEQDLRRRLSELNESSSTEERVQAALLELLPAGNSSISAVAKKLGAGPRTLQRRLKAEGISFRKILDKTREALARHYLGHSDMSGAEISFLLGFEDPNSFFRAFHSWTGITPETARRQMSQSLPKQMAQSA